MKTNLKIALLIGVFTSSIYGLSIYKTAQGNAVDAVEFSRVVRDDVVKVFKTQLPQLEGVSFDIDTFQISKATACGISDKRTGAFYCSGDGHIAVPVDFMNSICSSGACPAKASLEYVHAPIIAHEACHRVQDVLGYNQKQNAMWRGVETDEWLRESVKLEQQCDCYAGVYMATRFSKSSIKDVLPIGQKLFNALGDDVVNPSLSPTQFSHGKGSDRAMAFTRGYAAMSVKACSIQ